MNNQTIEAPNWGHAEPKPAPLNYYAPYRKDVLDDTVMVFGPYSGYKISEVPAWWLLWYLNINTEVKNYYLMEYINFHLEVLELKVSQAKKTII